MHKVHDLNDFVYFCAIIHLVFAHFTTMQANAAYTKIACYVSSGSIVRVEWISTFHPFIPVRASVCTERRDTFVSAMVAHTHTQHCGALTCSIVMYRGWPLRAYRISSTAGMQSSKEDSDHYRAPSGIPMHAPWWWKATKLFSLSLFHSRQSELIKLI
jgi:hypothetical protein